MVITRFGFLLLVEMPRLTYRTGLTLLLLAGAFLLADHLLAPPPG